MKKIIFAGIILVFIVAAVFLLFKIKGRQVPAPPNQPVTTQTPMTISSLVFLDNQNIPVKYTCDGDGVSPPLNFSNVPPKAQSLALTVTDPDAPNGLWVHWLVWNISASTTQIRENSVPAQAIQGQGSSGQKVYGAPCPPSGTHRYIFTLYALDEKLPIPSYSVLDDLAKTMQGHILQQAQIIGLYGRSK